MFKSFMAVLFMACLLLLAVGCSDDDSTSSPQSNHLNLLDIEDLVEETAPPEYTAPSGGPAATDSFEIWTTGEYALLGKVFGTEDPQTLYKNLYEFTEFLEAVQHMVQTDEDGNIITGVYIDSSMVEMEGEGLVMAHFTATITELEEVTTIPAIGQTILGETVDLDLLITVESDIFTAMQFGVTINETEQTILSFHNNDQGDKEETILILASMDPTDSSYTFRGVGWVGYDNGNIFGFGYNITSESTSDFTYRMSWYANELEEDMLGCIVGGGNKDVEFALKYRQFMPADAEEMDEFSAYDQVFGPNYAEGTSLISEFEEFVNEDLIYTIDAIPVEDFPSPWAE